MSGSVNKVILVGSCGQDPEVRSTQDGRRIVNLSIATSETWRDKASGERKEKTEWHRVVIFNERIAEVAEKYVHKGSKIYIEGQLQTRKWQDQSGQDRYSTEVVLQNFRGELVLLSDGRSGGNREPGDDSGDPGSFGGGRSTSSRGPYGQRRDPPRSSGSGGGSGNDLDEEIPF